jgi:regulatory subunit for Cdc7p protein kinase
LLAHVDLLQHVISRKHRKFAQNDGNFYEVDAVLYRVQRKTLAQVEEERRQWEALLNRHRLTSDAPSETEPLELLADDEAVRRNDPDPILQVDVHQSDHNDEEDI